VEPQAIRVTVRLHAQLARFAPQAEHGVVALDLPPGSVVRDVLGRFALPTTRRIIVGLNGASAAEDTVLRGGDRLDLVTPMSGG
jgi:sulfur carrier protein ThiS